MGLYRLGAASAAATIDVTPDVTTVRVIDIVVIGPVLVLAGVWSGTLPAILRAALLVFGVTTIAYNARRL